MQGQQLPTHQDREQEEQQHGANAADCFSIPAAQDAGAVHVTGGLAG